MRTLRLVTVGCAGVALAAALGAPGAARSDSGEKTRKLGARHTTQGGTDAISPLKRAGKAEPSGPVVHPKLAGSPALQKAAQAAGRAEQFRGRAQGQGTGVDDFAARKQKKTSNRTQLERVTLPAGHDKAGRDKIRGAGTGGGDVDEVEPNDSLAQVLADLPVNVVGTISSPSDVADCFAVPVTQGDPIRVEVVSDRVFNTALDSYLTVLRDDGQTVIMENDDGFLNSVDSFIRFTAPYTGNVFVCVQDSAGFGDPSFLYVLNVTVANPPDFSEEEFNDTTGSADVLQPPAIIFGDMGATNDVDVYTFSGTAGTTIVVDVDAAIFLSPLDSVVGFYDDGGGLLFGYDDDQGDPSNPDTRFNIVLPYTGTYFLSVADAFGRGNGAGDYYYSLSLTTQSGALAPRVTGVKITQAGFAKKVIGARFKPNAVVELTTDNTVAVPVPGRNAPAKPTTVIKLTPPIEVFSGDVFTVVNRDGRRSNPGVLN